MAMAYLAELSEFTHRFFQMMFAMPSFYQQEFMHDLHMATCLQLQDLGAACLRCIDRFRSTICVFSLIPSMAAMYPRGMAQLCRPSTDWNICHQLWHASLPMQELQVNVIEQCMQYGHADFDINPSQAA